LPIISFLHISLNSYELVFLINSFLFNDLYKSIFEACKNLDEKSQSWRIDLILYIIYMTWFDIINTVYLKFSYICKNIKFLYLTNLLGNLISLVFDIYIIYHQKENWLAYKEVYMYCWSDFFFWFNWRNYKYTLLIFFFDIFYWIKTNYLMIGMFTNYLALLNDCPIESLIVLSDNILLNFLYLNNCRKRHALFFNINRIMIFDSIL